MKKKILFVINTLGRAGAETAMAALMYKLDPEQYDISLYVLLGQGEMLHELPGYVRVLNKKYSEESVLSPRGKRILAKTVLKDCFCHASVFRNLPYLIKNGLDMALGKNRFSAEKLLWKVVSDGCMRIKEHYDLAIAYLEGGAAYYVHDHVMADRKAGFVHIDYTQAGYTRRLDRDCYVDYDRIFTVSDEVRGRFVSVYGECSAKTAVFHNFINEEAVLRQADKGIPEKLRPKQGATVLLTVGRLTYQKGYDVAVQALKCLTDKGYDAYWYILGEGPEHKALLEQAEKEGLSGRFVMLGKRDNPYPYYRAADIYVHATRFEGKSIAIEEAQILGCPIIASDCSGNREQVNDGQDGLLCRFTPEGIAESIICFIEDMDLAKACGKRAALRQINHIEDLKQIEELASAR